MIFVLTLDKRTTTRTPIKGVKASLVLRTRAALMRSRACNWAACQGTDSSFPIQTRPAISRNTTHDKCRPREPTKATTPLTKKVAAMTLDNIRAEASSGDDARVKIKAAAP